MTPAEEQLYHALRRGYQKKVEERRRGKAEVIAEIRTRQSNTCDEEDNLVMSWANNMEPPIDRSIPPYDKT